VTMSGDATITNAGLLSLKNTGTAGTYTKVITDAQGRVTSGSALASGDVTAALGYTPADAAAAGYVNGGNTFSGNATIGLNDAYTLGFKTNNATRMTLDSSGNLGLGTATPGRKLHLQYTMNSGDDGIMLENLGNAGANLSLKASGAGGHEYMLLSTGSANSTGAGFFGIYDQSIPTYRMVIGPTGNVGFGTSAPGYTLDLGSRTDALRLPSGLDATRPANATGLIRYNTTSNVVEYNNGSAWVTVGSSLGYTPVNKAGDTMSGSLMLAAGQYLGLGSGSTAGTVAGQMWYDSGVIKYFDGTTVKSLGVAGSGITSLNGLTANVQSFVVGSAGNAPAITSAGSAHTLDIPMASASGSVTAGLISNADYASMMAKQSNTLAAGQMWVGNASGVAQAFSLSGDVASVSNSGSVVVNKTTTGASNTILSLDGTGVANVYGVGVKGATSGTVTLQAAATTANYSLKLPATTPAANQVMQSDALGNLSWATALTSTSGYVNGGNSFGATASLGTNDNYDLNVRTNGATRFSFLKTGEVGIAPFAGGANLQVNEGNVEVSRQDSWPEFTVSGYGSSGGNYWNPQINLTYARGTRASPTYAQNGDTLGALRSSNHTNGLGAYLRFDATENHTASASGTKISLVTVPNGSNLGNVALSIAQDGKVGVGSSAPAYSLDMQDKTDAMRIPVGNTSQRPTNATGLLRYNTTNSNVEFNNGTTWTALSSGGGSAYINGGNTFSGNATIGLNDAYTLGFKTNNTTQMTLDSSGKLGIGTATPASKLHVYSTANADNAVTIGVAGSGNSEKAKVNLMTWSDGNVLGATSNNRGWAMTAYGNSYGTSDANDLDFSYWGGVAWTQGLRLEQTGKVGIGTSDPQYSLDFNSRTDAIRLPAGTTAQQPTAAAGLIRYNTTNSNIEFNNGSTWTALATGTGSGYVNGGNSFAGNATIGLNDAYNLSVKTNNATRMTFTGNGNIGILTTSPQAALHIADTNATGSSYSPLTIGTNAGAHVGIDFDSVQAYNGGSNSILYLNYWGGDIGFGDASKMKFDRTNSKLALLAGGSIDVASTGTIATANGSISSSYGNIYTTTGKIGAGGAPSYSIDAGTNTDALRLPRGTTAQQPANAAGLIRYNTSNNNIEYNNGSGWSVLATSSGSSGAFVNGGNSFGAATSLGTNDGNALTLKTNGTTALTLDTSQNMSTAGDFTMTSGKSLMFGTSAYSFVNGTGGASSYLNFGTSGAIVMTLDVNGRVGIGTNPQFSLDIGSRTDSIRLPAGTDAQRPANTAGQIRYNTTSNVVEFNNGSTWSALGGGGGSSYVNGGNSYGANATIGLNDNYNLGFKTNNATQMTLSNAGNLGVGTASPAAKVHIKGSAPTSVTVANEYLHIGGTEQTSGGYQVIGFGYYSSEAYPNAYMGLVQTSVAGSGKGDLVFGARNSTADVAPSELMRINSAGGVGIGTSTINNNLSFSGQSAQKVGVERITTSGTAGSDFTITAGGAYSGGTNLAGGTLTLSSGTSTGTGGSQILLQTASSGTTGTADRAPATKVTISGTANSDTMAVAGTIRGTSVDNASSTTIDWSKGNTQYTAAGCTGTQYTFSNMRDGGVYTLAITGTFSANCTFGQTSPDTLSGTPGSGNFYFLPANSIPSGSNAIFSFMRVGSKVYVQWNSGFQN
ncbi:MAG: hypothetical protein JSU04_14795, partial [Bdellovibrionales bacterium]|nr:hypothetical protein [Bdellovibrionales bacterium]